MNIGAHPVRLCVLLLFCFGLQISELLPTRRTAATDRVGDQLLRVPADRAGTEELLTDDGAAEILIRFENVSVLCVNRLKPTLYPATLQTIRIFFFPFPSNPAGAQIRLIAFESGQSQIQPPPNPTLLVDQTVTIPSLPPLGGFIDFPIQNGPIINSGDFYVGFQAPNPTGAVTFAGDTGQPSLFAANADGRGPAVAFAVRARADGSRINESMLRLDPALNRLVLVPISLGAESDQVFVILFGTGIRGVNSLSAVSATIGGVPVMVGFAGAQTEFVGVDQLNIGPLTRDLAGRGEVDVVITVEGKVANTVKIAIE